MSIRMEDQREVATRWPYFSFLKLNVSNSIKPTKTKQKHLKIQKGTQSRLKRETVTLTKSLCMIYFLLVNKLRKSGFG